jgi:hypothetical protein
MVCLLPGIIRAILNYQERNIIMEIFIEDKNGNMTVLGKNAIAHRVKQGVLDYNYENARFGNKSAKYKSHHLTVHNSGKITLVLSMELPDGWQNNYEIALN